MPSQAADMYRRGEGRMDFMVATAPVAGSNRKISSFHVEPELPPKMKTWVPFQIALAPCRLPGSASST